MNKGTGNFARFETLADGVTACVELYDRFYDMLDPHTLVARWADNGANQGYKNAVASCF